MPDGDVFDPYSGFVFTLNEDEEEFQNKRISKYLVFEGFLRKDEEEDYMLGKVIREREGSVNRIDLKRMVGFFQYANLGADMYYLDRSVEDLEKSSEQLPIPNSYTDTMKHLEDYEKNSNYRKMKILAGLSVLGVAGSVLI